MIPPLWRIHVAYLRRRPWQSGLALMGIALGVMVVVAIQLALHAARDAFATARSAVNGHATHRVEALSGDLPESLYVRLALQIPDLRASPVLVADVQTIAGTPRWLRLLGVDGFSVLGGDDTALAPGLAGQDCVLLSPAARRHLDIDAGEDLRFRTGTRRSGLRTCKPPPAAIALTLPDDLLLADLAAAQLALGRPGRLSHIDLVLPQGSQRTQALAAVREVLAGTARLRDLESEYALRGDFSRAFDTNLAALSFSALLVGMFLVYNTQSFLVLQRRGLYARLRAIGVRPGEIRSAVLIEAAFVGLAASLLGASGGLLLATRLLGLVTTTLNSFYYPVAAHALAPSALLLSGGVALGTLATVMAALPAAAQAAGTPPLAARGYEAVPSTGHGRGPRFAVGLTPALVAATWLADSLANLRVDFAVLAAWLLWSAALIPPLLQGLTRVATRFLATPATWPEQLGLQTLRRAGSRTAIAASALGIAAGLSLGMQIMTASFRAAVDDWLAGLLIADAYVAVAEQVPTDAAEEVMVALKAGLQRSPSLLAISSVFRRELIDSTTGLIQISVYDLPARARSGFQFIAGTPARAWPRWARGDAVLVTEPFATRRGLAPGMRVSLPTPRGLAPFEVVGVLRDYSSERGIVLLSADSYARHWGPARVSGIGLYLRDGTRLQDLQREILSQVPDEIPVQLRTRDGIRALSLKIFDETFAITRLLGGIALAVAMLGVAAALLAQQLERAREYSLLRALGVRGGLLLRVILVQTLAIGIVAAMAAVPVGIGCAWFLVHFINLHAFGWTMPMSGASAPLITVVCGVVASAVLAALYPAIRAARLAPARALRDE